MPFKPLVTAGIESLLNTFLYRSPALKTARSRLLGKVLRVEVKGFSTSLILVFSERQVDVLGEWAGDADCTVIAYASVLPKLRDRQQLTALIRSGELEVQGDIQVVQNFVALADQMHSLQEAQDIARSILERDVRINSNEELALPKEKLQELHI